MKDFNGDEVAVGDKVVLLHRKDDYEFEGRTGEIHSVSLLHDGELAWIVDRLDGSPSWSAWCDSSEFVLIESKRPAPLDLSEHEPVSPFARFMASAGANVTPEMAWDAAVEACREIADDLYILKFDGSAIAERIAALKVGK